MIDRSYLNPSGQVATCFFASLWNTLPYDDMPVSYAVKAIADQYLPFVVQISSADNQNSAVWEWLHQDASGAWHNHSNSHGDLTIQFEDESDAVAFKLFLG